MTAGIAAWRKQQAASKKSCVLPQNRAPRALAHASARGIDWWREMLAASYQRGASMMVAARARKRAARRSEITRVAAIGAAYLAHAHGVSAQAYV